MRWTLALLALLLVPGVARAADHDVDEDPDDDVRPVRFASVEINPLGALVDRWGGQLQVALMGPLTLVGGASRLDGAAVRGWTTEVGSRLFFGLAPRRADGTRIAHVHLGAMFLADDLRVGDTRGERRGIAIDVGVHARIVHGFYALGGVGLAHRSTDLDIPDRLERMKTTPRLLLAIGWGL